MTGKSLFENYNTPTGLWDEMSTGNAIRQQYQKLYEAICPSDTQALFQKEQLANELFMNQGITFTVYSDNAGIERIFPFDILPRIITNAEWTHIEKGIQQRLKALGSQLDNTS